MFYIKNSKNGKLGSGVDAIYAPIKNTCPNSCPLKNNGCYAQNSYCGIFNKRLENQLIDISPINVARLIAKEIDESYSVVPKKDLRLFVSGDSRTLAGTRIINKAVFRWRKRGGGDCWSYTHAWKNVPRKEWDQVSILASVTTVDEVPAAKQQGYAPAIVVSEHPSEKVYKLEGSDVKWIPCPAQTKENVSCSDCRLCFNANRLFDQNMGIAFPAHGAQKNVIKRRLQVIK